MLYRVLSAHKATLLTHRYLYAIQLDKHCAMVNKNYTMVKKYGKKVVKGRNTLSRPQHAEPLRADPPCLPYTLE